MSDDIRVPRFYIQHGVIHDNVTGKHVTCDPDTRTLEGCGPNGEDVVHKNPDGITSTLDLLNGLCRHETSELAASLITCAESRCECCDGWLDEAERLMREAAAALLAAPPAAQPMGELDKETFVHEVMAAMQAVWDDHCADTGCYPHDIQKGSKRGELEFHAGQWARGTAEWTYARLRKPLDTQTAQPDSAQEALAAFIANPQPVMPVEGKVTEEMVDRALAEFLDWSFEGWHASMKKAGGDAELNDAMRAALEAALGQPVDAQGKV